MTPRFFVEPDPQAPDLRPILVPTLEVPPSPTRTNT